MFCVFFKRTFLQNVSLWKIFFIPKSVVSQPTFELWGLLVQSVVDSSMTSAGMRGRSHGPFPHSWKKIVHIIDQLFPTDYVFWHDQFPFLEFVFQPRPSSHLARLGFWWRARRAFSSSNSSLSAAFSSLSFVFSCLTFGQNTILLLRVCVFALCVDVLQKSWLWNFISLQIKDLSTDLDYPKRS